MRRSLGLCSRGSRKVSLGLLVPPGSWWFGEQSEAGYDRRPDTLRTGGVGADLMCNVSTLRRCGQGVSKQMQLLLADVLGLID